MNALKRKATRALFITTLLLRMHHHLLLALAALLFCSACDTYDPNYTNLAATAAANPAPGAIHGMWHRKWGDGMGGNEKWSILFLPDKTGHYDSLITDWFVHDDKQGKFTWNYGDNGVWKTTLPANTPAEGFGAWLKYPTTWRVSGSNLLQHTSVPDGNWYMVWERVEP